MTYVSKLTTQDTKSVTESTVLASLESLNQPDWIELLDDTLRRKGSVMSVLVPNPGDDLLDYLRAQITKLGEATQRLVGRALDINLSDYLRGKNDDLISDALIFVAASPIGFNGYTLLQIALDNTRTINCRIQAGRALANHASRTLHTSSAIDEFLDIDLKSHPHLASAVVSILTRNDGQKKAIETLVCLTKKPDNIEHPLRSAIRMILRRDTGPDDIQKFSSEAPIWLREFLVDELLKIDLKSHPHFASVVVSILTSNDRPEKAIEALVCLTKKPDNIEHPLRSAIRMILRRDTGPNDIQKFSLKAPIWLRGFLDSVVSNPISDRTIDYKDYLSCNIEKIEEPHKLLVLNRHQVNAIKTRAVQRGLSRRQAIEEKLSQTDINAAFDKVRRQENKSPNEVFADQFNRLKYADLNVSKLELPGLSLCSRPFDADWIPDQGEG